MWSYDQTLSEQFNENEQAMHIVLLKNLPSAYFIQASHVATLEEVQKDLVFYNI